MNSALERLLTLRVGDIMARNVVQIPAHGTMAQAAQLMIEHEISGAPVVDEHGHCVGVLSGTSFASRERACAAREELPRGLVEHVLVRERTDQPYHIEDVVEDVVRHYMSPAVQTIRPNATIMEAARMLCQEHLHRLIVLDEHSRPSGIVSSLDIVAALIKVMQE